MIGPPANGRPVDDPGTIKEEDRSDSPRRQRSVVGARNLRLTISYDGTELAGWQRQPGQRTAQELIERAIGALTGVTPVVTASGRTDAGVHAVGQVAHFYTAAPYTAEVFVRALNANLPDDVRILQVLDESQAFHATFDARTKMYRYILDNGPVPSPLHRRASHHVPVRLDLEAMRRATEALQGRHDFRSFETHWPNRTSSIRTIVRIAVNRVGRFLWVDVEADGFLYNMVRAIAGTLVLVGRGRWSPERVAEALHAGDRRLAGPTAPPHGLVLVHVNYDHPQIPTATLTALNHEHFAYHHEDDPGRRPGEHTADRRGAAPSLSG